MNLIELQSVLLGFGLPLAYIEFPEESSPELPFIVFLDHVPGDGGIYGEHKDIKADNKNYVRSRLIRVELYTDSHHESALHGIQLAEGLEDHMTEHGILWDYEGKAKVEAEKMHMTAWTINLMY